MNVEQREEHRRLLRVRAQVEMAGRVLEVRTHDISATGVSLLLPFPAPINTTAQFKFSVFNDGKLRTVSAVGRSTHCTLSADFFRTGFKFTSVDAEGRKVISAYCNDR